VRRASTGRCRRRSRVLRPRTGSPRGGRIMGVRVSEDRRTASHSRVRWRRTSSDSRSDSPHGGLVDTRRTREPRGRTK